MTNVKSYLIHLLYRLFLSLQKIQNINLQVKVKSITTTEKNLIETFCLSTEPSIIKLFHSILTKNNADKIKTYHPSFAESIPIGCNTALNTLGDYAAQLKAMMQSVIKRLPK
jgi:hypothetical protein